MNSVKISKIWIDDSASLCIQPQTTTFELIYRSGMGVHWNSDRRFLYSQPIRSWSPLDWFLQIVSAVEIEYGYHLLITEDTKWQNIDKLIKQSILAENKRRDTRAN